ncbi:MAG: hypothetical protein UMV23_02690 [Halanaerobium sp.]|nr:hypothetical protein [Halanaerobium sp.]
MNTLTVITFCVGCYLYQVIMFRGLFIIIEKMISSLPLQILRNWTYGKKGPEPGKKEEKAREKYIGLYQKLFVRPPYPMTGRIARVI